MSTLRERKRIRTRTTIAATAMRLFAERGFAAVTIADVAAAADVGERTVYRHYADKEELLFGEDDAFAQALADALAARPDGEAAVTAVARAARAVLGGLGERRKELEARTALICLVPALQARERTKQARFEAILADGLAARGTDPPAARLLGRIAIACYDEALSEWLNGGPGGLGARFDAKLADAATILRAR